jgi:hypothetical protein
MVVGGERMNTMIMMNKKSMLVDFFYPLILTMRMRIKIYITTRIKEIINEIIIINHINTKMKMRNIS